MMNRPANVIGTYDPKTGKVETWSAAKPGGDGITCKPPIAEHAAPVNEVEFGPRPKPLPRRDIP